MKKNRIPLIIYQAQPAETHVTENNGDYYHILSGRTSPKFNPELGSLVDFNGLAYVVEFVGSPTNICRDIKISRRFKSGETHPIGYYYLDHIKKVMEMNGKNTDVRKALAKELRETRQAIQEKRLIERYMHINSGAISSLEL